MSKQDFQHNIRQLFARLEAINQSIQKDSSNPRLYIKRAYFYLTELEEMDYSNSSAIKDLCQAITVAPECAQAYTLLEKLVTHEDMLGIHNDMIKQFPNSAMRYFMRAAFHDAVRQNPKDALVDLNQALTLDRNFSAAYLHRGCMLEEIDEDYKGALANFNQAILWGKSSVAFFKRGMLYFEKLHDPKSAYDDFKEVIRLGDAKNDWVKEAQECLDTIKNSGVLLEPRKGHWQISVQLNNVTREGIDPYGI